MKKLISVIIPVYKVENEIRDCVDSVLSQTYSNMEIFLVDDGSPDSCPIICDAYALRDNRVKVIHKMNGGLSDARNAALKLCAGEYVAFVDSDDVISKDCIERLAKAAAEQAADIVVSPFQKFRAVDELFTDDALLNCQTAKVNSQKALELLLYQDSLFETGVPGKLFKKSLFDGIEFPVGYYYEDLATTYKLILKSSIVVGVNKRMYGYRIRPDSIMRQNYSEKMLSCIPISRSLFHDISEAVPELSAAAASRAFSVNRAIFLSLPCERKEERSLIWEELKKYRKMVLMDSKARKRERVMALFSFFGKNVFYLLSPLYKKQQMGVS